MKLFAHDSQSEDALPAFPPLDIRLRLGPSLDVVWTDAEWLDAAGYDADRTIGQPFHLFLPETQRARWSRHVAMWRDLRAEEWHLPLDIRIQDGSTLRVVLEARAGFDDQGELVGAACLLRRYSIEATRNSDPIASVATYTADAIIITDAEPLDEPGPRIQYVNPAFEHQTGYSLSEVIGRNPRLLQGSETDFAATRALGQALRKWDSPSVELLNYRKDGTEFWAELSVVPVADETGWFTHWVAVQRDVTPRKLIEGRLAESENRFRTIVESLPGVVYRCADDDEWSTLFISDYALDLTGYRQEDFIEGRVTFLTMIHPEDVEHVRSVIGEANSERSPYEVRYRLRRADGELRWVVDRGRAVHTDDGKVAWLDGVILDVTREKVREERLELLEAAVHDTTESILITDADLEAPGPRILYVNPGFERMTGYSLEEVVGRNPRLLQGPATDRLFLDSLRRRLEAGQDFSGETINYRKDGTPFAVEWSISPVVTAGGVKRYVAVQRDVTERRKEEARMRMLEAALANAHDAVIVLKSGARPEDDARVVYVNRSFETRTGMSAESVLGKSYWYPGATDDDGLFGSIKTILNEGRPSTLESEIEISTGQRIPVECVFSPVPDARGAIAHWVVVQRDLSESRRVEAETALRMRAEEIVRMRSAFLDNMSHEIRTPLTGILGFAAVLREEVSGDAAEFVDMIEESGRRLSSTLEAVLQVTLLESDDYEFTSESFDVEDVIDEALTPYRRLIREKQIELTCEVEPQAVVTDPSAFRHILDALVDNAVKFTEAGSIEIRIDRCRDGFDLRVIDTGRGMSSEFIPYAMDDFRQESDGLDRSHEGSGMGLALVRRLAERLNAEVELKSTQGEGTECIVRFRSTPASHGA